MAALALVLSACASPRVEEAPATVGTSHRSARQYAVTAERALQSTAFEALGTDRVTDTLVLLCDGFGRGAIGAVVDGFDIEAPSGDRDILVEVLGVGMHQVCPNRAAIDLTPVFLDAVRSSAASAGALRAFDEGSVVRAGLQVCPVFDAGGGPEAALLDVVVRLFDVEAAAADRLSDHIDDAQGIVAGSTLAAATALLCPARVAEVTAFMESL